MVRRLGRATGPKMRRDETRRDARDGDADALSPLKAPLFSAGRHALDFSHFRGSRIGGRGRAERKDGCIVGDGVGRRENRRRARRKKGECRCRARVDVEPEGIRVGEACLLEVE